MIAVINVIMKQLASNRLGVTDFGQKYCYLCNLRFKVNNLGLH